MSPSTWLRASAAALLIVPLGAVAAAGGASADDGRRLTLERKLTPSSVATADKSSSSRLAQTDKSLLGRADSTKVPVVIKLDYDAVATYAGDVAGLAATSPATTGTALRGASNEKKYETYIAGRERTFAASLAKAAPTAKIGRSLRTVYGGVAASVPANRISALLRIPGVVAVQKDELRQPLTDSSTKFIGADSLNGALGGASNAGKGVIFGSLDSGAWPEHPSFADNGNLSAPPAKADGTARTCDFGDNPLTDGPDVFACNDKLIGGEPFIDTYNSQVGGEVYADSARDSDGHGTHTASTTAGNVVSSATVFGVQRGPIRGVAPGAWVSVYKVCGAEGCFSSDSMEAVGQAIKDGVNVINYSISGGANPFTDAVELAFLDAYAAGVFVAASAGNSGPGGGTTDHVSPWVTTVAASTQTREFSSTLTLKSGAATLVLTGASIMGGVAAQTPVVLASAAPYSSPLCTKKATPADLLTGKIVVCQRGSNGRVEKGYNVMSGGAAGMILFNATLQDTETDNHWLPALHIADGAELVAWLADPAHAVVTGAFTPGVKANGQGDVMAAFSSRGPGGFGIKPDITAPGVQILAGQTPTPDSITGGPAGEYYMAIAGTSMSAPHIAGSAILEKALHKTWTPGQIKSALMTTARGKVVKEDGVTPTDPFDDGSGRVDLARSANPGLTFDETAEDMFTLGADKVQAIDLNLPSINAPVMPGSVTTVRTAKNVTSRSLTYEVSTKAPAQSTISVWPRRFTVRPGKSIDLRITITSTAPTGQYFGEVRLEPKGSSLPKLHLPVAFVPQQAEVKLTSSCSPTSIARGTTSDCTITATNTSASDAAVALSTKVDDELRVVGVTGATQTGSRSVQKPAVTLAAAAPGVPSIGPAGFEGFFPLAVAGIDPEAIGDEEILNYPVPSFLFNGRSYSSIGVTSNGYLVAGGGTSTDVAYEALLPDAAAPNNVLAPFWTDLDGGGATGISAAVLTDGVSSWIVVEWDLFVFGTSQREHFQAWLGINGTQDISFSYDPDDLPTTPGAQSFAVGAENTVGQGQALAAGVLPTEDLVVTSTAPTPGGTATYTVKVKGESRGSGVVTSSMTSSSISGTTIVKSGITVTK